MTRKLAAVAAVFVVTLVASVTSAQIIYLPVQYQYGQQDTYYYGGSDPSIFRQAERDSALRARNNVSNEPVRVYSDLLPFRNARVFGFTIDDARNEAYANAPRYFRKRDLLAGAVNVDGTIYVPPTAPRRYDETVVTRPVISQEERPRNKGVIIIIPRKPAKQENLSKPAMFVSAGN